MSFISKKALASNKRLNIFLIPDKLSYLISLANMKKFINESETQKLFKLVHDKANSSSLFADKITYSAIVGSIILFPKTPYLVMLLSNLIIPGFFGSILKYKFWVSSDLLPLNK